MAETNSTAASITPPVKKKLTPQEKCVSRGGTWDGSKCILPSVGKVKDLGKRETGTDYTPTLLERQQAEAQAKAKAERDARLKAEAEARAKAGLGVGEFSGQVDITRDDTVSGGEGKKDLTKQNITFNQDGTVTVDGEILSRDKYQSVLNAQRGIAGDFKGGVPAGNQTIGAAGKTIQDIADPRAAALREQVGQIGQVGGLAPVTEAPINFSQAITAGLAGSAAGIAGGAALGLATGGAFSIPLAAAGAVAGLVTGIISNIKVQQSGELKSAKIELTNARTNMRQLAMLASQDPANADVYISQYNKQLTRVYQARRQTKVEVQGDLNAWIEDGREQLADFDLFLLEGGTADIYGQKLKSSLQTGVPLSIQGELLL